MYSNPYSNLPVEELTKLQSMVAKEDYDLLKSIRLRNGTVTTTVNILLSKLIKEMKRRGMKDVSSHALFEYFVVNCHIVLPEEVDFLEYNKIGLRKGKVRGQ